MGKDNATRDSAVETVVNGVKNLILSGKFSPGNKLPTEVQLMRQLSVSRSSIREGIKILKTLGLVNVIRGDGTYVSEPDSTSLFQTLLLNFNLLKPDIDEVIEFREVLELSVSFCVLGCPPGRTFLWLLLEWRFERFIFLLEFWNFSIL